MAKGQQRSGREPKKPKADKKTTLASAPDARRELPSKIAGPKDRGK